MRVSWVLPLSLLPLACGAPPGTPEDGACALYADDADAFGYCVAVAASSLGREEADARCAPLGPWEDDCRSRWITARLREIGGAPSASGFGLLCDDPTRIRRADALLDFCEDDDCRFLVVDRFRDVDLANQLLRCTGVGRYEGDCGTHAVQGWRERRATRAEVDALWAAIPGLPGGARDRAAEAAGYAYQCAGVPCPTGDRAAACHVGWSAARDHGCEPLQPGTVGVPQPPR